MAERINRGHNRLQEWGLKGAAIIALGAAGLGLVGCGNEKAGASHAPETTASASATPGSSEGSPTPSETSSETRDPAQALENAKAELAKMGETNLANSKVYNELSEVDQKAVEKNSKLSFDDFEKLDPEARAMVALVISDSHRAQFIEGVGNLIIPGNNNQQLKDIYIPALDKHSNAAQDLYNWVMKSTPKDVTPSNNGQPYFRVQLERAIAAAMASTGDPQLLEDAKKVVGGSLYHGSELAVGGGVSYDQEGWGNLSERVKELTTMNETKTNTLKDLGYPDAGTSGHFFANAVGGDFDGYPAQVTLKFEIYNAETHSMEPGVNSDGAGAAAYHAIEYKDKDGVPHVTWSETQTTASPDGSGIGVIEPNTTK